jgi:hypothetical protein
MGWIAVAASKQVSPPALDRPRNRRQQPMQPHRMAEARVRSHYRS